MSTFKALLSPDPAVKQFLTLLSHFALKEILNGKKSQSSEFLLFYCLSKTKGKTFI